MALALLVIAGVASAAPQQDLVSGTGYTRVGDTDWKLQVTAQSGPNGEDARGYFDALLPGITDISGQVTCLNVEGNLAAVRGVVTKYRDGRIPEGATVIFTILDGGPSEQDRWAISGLQEPPNVCEPSDPATRAPVTSGNFVVHDATTPAATP